MAENKLPWIETPLVWSRSISKAAGCNVYLKLENTQPSGSFKSRGIGNFLKARLAESAAQGHGKPTHFFCSSGGNAGLACVHAAVTLSCPATIVVPLSTSDYMIQKLRDAGAKDVIQIGKSWFEADQYLKETLLPKASESGENAVYTPPFDHPDIWAGNATVIDEIAKQLPEVDRHYPVVAKEPNSISSAAPDAIVCSVGGGGLFNGIMQGVAKNFSSSPPHIIATETFGADSLAQSFQAGELITLPAITSIATTLGARTVSRQAFEYAMDKKAVTCAVFEDKDAVDACRRFADDERILVEPSCGVALAVCYMGRLKQLMPRLTEDSKVVVVVCGGSGMSTEILRGYVEKFFPP
ncbi:L-serine dehydratase [Fulvia fulva]|uniref:L-serine ammonia-lyase n=1 Tax=Passalora fulva TaxID=5499 RepID=A0A9Q8PK71_PASFU|nr:L-serine dehydratase [Fulvia fulva]KAK4611882.1 L-serine dehydratase [Fulvia fulva]KAK4612993.1 L-serine dehydratase [Fulvia fulva]UJO23927.1 L-serine dehydratase [Fulvia fulva]WPV21620.1 L-serine dehydratase [Fulvia fulva]WPV36267.1 L-serine dehydratase [Fulvia fulva]